MRLCERRIVMIEIKEDKSINEPRIVVIGVGGGGNNAVDRMILSDIKGTNYVAINTDNQVLGMCKAQIKIQIGKKITNGYGAGANPEIGEAAAVENEEEIKNIVKMRIYVLLRLEWVVEQGQELRQL